MVIRTPRRKHLEHRVQTIARPLLDRMISGKALMGKVFALTAPLLDPTRAVDEFTRGDEQEGFSYLFMGMMQAIRNTGGHGDYPVYSEEEAFEILAFLSYLSRRLDLAEERLQLAATPEDGSGS
ncbi:TIGR02391 family protein [Streptacidiphilus sp. PAMC 29251]